MGETGSEESPAITPYLYYEDVVGALGWLSRVFGFEEQANETIRDPEGRVVHAKMKLGDGVVVMGFPGKDYICPKRLGHVTQNLYVYVDDVDAHYHRAKTAGATILSETEETFYGDRCCGAEDLEGHGTDRVAVGADPGAGLRVFLRPPTFSRVGTRQASA